MNFCRVALLSPPYAALTYAKPEWLEGFSWCAGLRVAIPLGKGALRVGVVIEDVEAPPEGVSARPMVWPLETAPLLPQAHMEMVRQLALRQAVTPGQILAAVLPAGLRVTGMRLRMFSEEGGKPRLYALRELPGMEPDERRHLGMAWMRGEAELLSPREDAAASEMCVLQYDPPWAIRPTAKRQFKILEFLFEEGAVSRRDVLRRLGQDIAPALDSLLKHGLICLRQTNDAEGSEESREEGACLLPPAAVPCVTFSPAQEQALARFRTALDAGKPVTHLLFGVTGSGKTAVYLELARECLKRGRSMLLLAPEVALAMKLRRDATNVLPQLVPEAFPDASLYFFHGYQTPQQRERTFRDLAQRKAPCLVVGTRSALFLPLPDLGAIVLDEEHDSSFKQDEGLTYQAKEVAWFRVAQAKGLLVLGSATPDLKTFYAAREERIPLSILPERVGGGTLPEIRLVDIRNADLAESLLVPESLSILGETIKRGEQAVVLLNRRGYAPLMYCLDCSKVVRCPHCEIGLTYHKGRERLICHYCGYNIPFPSPCPTCKGLHFHPMGQGTERIEEHIGSLLPTGGRVLRLDRDSTRRPGSMEAILESFARQEAQVLVGTQMLSKGHHFPEVTLAIVADGDLGLNMPDYRATERTFQLLVQSAGRAGRGEKPGQVLIQTRDTSHACWQFVKQGDYEGFYEHEIALRRRRRYPPFINLALLRISYPVEWEDGAAQLTKITTVLRTEGAVHRVTVLGPAPAPLPLLRGRRRFQCLFKSESWQAIRSLYAAVVPFAMPPHLRLSIDIDPVNML